MSDPRKPIFDAINDATDGNPFDVPGRIQTLHNLLDSWGVKRETVVNAGSLTTSRAGLALIKSFESCAKAIGGGRFEAYLCPAKVWTIGWGSTRDFDGNPVRQGLVWTQEECDRKKAQDMAAFESEVRAILGNTPTTQGQFDALVSFAYNVGSAALRGSTLMKKHKARDYAGAAAEFARWNKAGGRVLAGLTRRREAEAKLYRGQA